ncbi:hypothetical protein BCR39DRAFT_539094 [Naematelia encephala]|uniref:Pre-rRNA-processing protein RIX1 n=1 Tax=Naematelia encephala TaxID=71784 RepID=A0A1Y2AYY0_9TREE|nr:hypothetical protein BCR39DRAFT_539094 [Naematelia encephala]
MSDLTSIILTLPLSSTSLYDLIVTHRPFSHPSSLSQTSLSKFLNRLTATLTSRDTSSQDRIAACSVARQVIDQDIEGHVLSRSAKIWIPACLSQLGTPSSTTLPSLELIVVIIEHSSTYPSFERESVQPILGKLAVTICKLLSAPEPSTIRPLLEKTKQLIAHSPAPWRPSVPSLRNILIGLIMAPADYNTAIAASDVLASLCLCGGKAQVGESWKGGMRDALGGFGTALSGVSQDAWVEEIVRVVPPPAPAGFEQPADPIQRLATSVVRLGSWTQIILAYLRFHSPRPVPVPIAQIVAAGLRCLNLTLDTPIVAYISPLHHAALIASLPKIWSSGLSLLAGIATSVGDHLFPQLSQILDHSTWLAEKIPQTHIQIHTQLLRFHRLIFDLYPPALVAVEYPTRLLKVCLARMNPLLESRSLPLMDENEGGSKKGKKRARGGEDGLVGGLEGKERRDLAGDESEGIVEALLLAKLLHPTPLLSTSLLTFSIRLHLALHLRLFSFPPTSTTQCIRRALYDVLQSALLIPSARGTEQGWKTVIIATLDASEMNSEKVDLLLHPTLPPLHRSAPPIERGEEKALREELGFSVVGDDGMDGVEEGDSSARDRHPVQSQVGVTPIAKQSRQPLLPIASSVTAAPPPSVAASLSRVDPLSNSTTTAEASNQDTQGGAAVQAVDIESIEVSLKPEAPLIADSIPFMSTSNVLLADKGKSKAVETSEVRIGTDNESEGIPELDSGSSDEDMDDEEEEEEGDQDQD